MSSLSEKYPHFASGMSILVLSRQQVQEHTRSVVHGSVFWVWQRDPEPEGERMLTP